MSFSSNIKMELTRLRNKKECCDRAELAGIAAFCANFVYSEKKSIILRFSTENLQTAQRIGLLLKALCIKNTKNTKTQGAAGSVLYSVIVENAEELLRKLHFIEREAGVYRFRISKNYFERECCRRSFVKGAFLGGATVSNPEKSYHLEFVTRHKTISEEFLELLKLFDIKARKVKRNSYYVIYFNEANQIEDLINVTGAHNNLMEFMNVRILKEKRNNINRRKNCELGNIDKTVNASILQRSAIEKLQKAKKFESLPDSLKELAIVRLENPEASLSELGKLLTPPLSRSGVNHRLKKIIELSEGQK